MAWEGPLVPGVDRCGGGGLGVFMVVAVVVVVVMVMLVGLLGLGSRCWWGVGTRCFCLAVVPESEVTVQRTYGGELLRRSMK